MKTNVARRFGLSILMSKIIEGNFLSHLIFQILAEVDYSYNRRNCVVAVEENGRVFGRSTIDVIQGNFLNFCST